MRLFTILIFSLLISCSTGNVQYYLPVETKRVYSGLENFISNYADEYEDKKAILVSNHSGVNNVLKSNIELLRHKGINVSTVLAPEHGIYGYQNVYDKRMYVQDRNMNVLVYNLHKLDAKACRFLIKKADIVIFDIQDMGMRCYTYISNLKYIIDAMQGLKRELIVLDRPNPIAFLGIDGAYLEKRFASKYISAFPAPFIYDLTIGEAAYYYKTEYKPKTPIRIIKMRNYKPRMYYHNSSLPWVPPSPNLPTYESSIMYTAVVLMEGINISLGRGTPKPFEYIGAPWINPHTFSKDLTNLGLKNFRFRPIYFKPTFSKYKNKVCGGVQIFYTGGSFSPTEVSYRIISYLRKKYKQCRWKRFRRWYDVDYLAGTNKFRYSINKKLSYNAFYRKLEKKIESYEDRIYEYKLY